MEYRLITGETKLISIESNVKFIVSAGCMENGLQSVKKDGVLAFKFENGYFDTMDIHGSKLKVFPATISSFVVVSNISSESHLVIVFSLLFR